MSVVPSLNYIGFAVATVTQFFFGGIWYSALPTSGIWLRGMQKYLADPKWPTNRKDGANGNFTHLFFVEILLIAVRTYVTHHFLHYMNIKTLADSLKVFTIIHELVSSYFFAYNLVIILALAWLFFPSNLS
jgi:hypothetical protein